MGDAMPGALWSTEEIEWTRDQDPQLIEIWSCDSIPITPDLTPEEHLETREGSSNYRKSYLQNVLSISDHGDACNLLLSPEVVDEHDEWECWKLASWIPGANRFHSFEAWMIASYKFLKDFEEDETVEQ